MWFVMGSTMDSSHLHMKDLSVNSPQSENCYHQLHKKTFALFCMTFSCDSGKYVILLRRIDHGLLVAEVLSCMLEFRGFTEAWKFQCFPPPVAPVVAPGTRITSAVAPELLAVQVQQPASYFQTIKDLNRLCFPEITFQNRYPTKTNESLGWKLICRLAYYLHSDFVLRGQQGFFSSISSPQMKKKTL